MPLEWFLSPSMWTLFGVDFLSGLRRNRRSARVFGILRSQSPRDLRRLHGLALVNHRRQEAVCRWLSIAFLTLPASAALTLSELSPATLRQIASAEGPGRWYLMLAYAAGVVALYTMFAWRARQLLTLIELWLIQEDVATAGDHDPGSPLEMPLGG